MTKRKPTLPRLPALDWAPARGALLLSGAALLAGMTVLFGWVDWPALGRWARPHAVPLALFAAAGVGMTAAGWRLRGQHAPRTRASGMSWWVVAAAAIVVVVVAWVATNWLLGEATAAKDPGAARVDAIKTGLGIGAGTTGIFALLLAVRRQWHNESDATEKNVTELYTKAADQLGSIEAPVRLAGLYALERLAHDNPEQRQSIVNVICAYLRMPYTPPSSAPAADSVEHQEWIQEREVRLAGQRILTDHLAPQNRRKFWADIDLDLTDAHLIDFTPRNCRPRIGRFSGTTFTGDAFFDSATFTGSAFFDSATFTGDALFDSATFTDQAWFRGATFTREAWFDNATFTCEAWFDSATFTDHAWFNEAAFTGDAAFGGATFTGNALFDSATFTDQAWFRGATFTRKATFYNATFTDHVWFRGATFIRKASFDNATFSGQAVFDRAIFTSEATFDNATFSGDASFASATFTGALPTIDRRLAEKAVFTNVILTSYSQDRTTVSGIVVDVRGQATADEAEVSREPQSPA
ncbi:pentapeptide repeat-containing protein [Amycolatopsis sp. NPDC051758]|uniref:pentapeptide repeat-containing protein n=1 Tax=Amycolatopsis sp. NPDC051758 TaxID=3363935 RepID=UPI0037AE8DF3